MITVDSLTKSYGGFTAVDDVSFTARPGRVTGFLGPNGAGKSTTMRVMVGLTPPTSGSATIEGRRFADLPNPGREVGVLLDASAQHAGRTGREILTVAARTMGLPLIRVEQMIGRVGLTETQARAEGRRVLVGTRPMTRVGRAVEKGETRGFMKVIADAGTRTILGASILGVGGDEVIHGIIDMMQAGATADVLRWAVPIHPTVSELIPTVIGEMRPA